MNVKLLLDENISPKVAAVLCREGIDACGVRDRGLLEATDPEVFARAFVEDRVVVTINVGDFEKLASACELHAGVVLIDMVNTMLRVAFDGTMSFEVVPLSK